MNLPGKQFENTNIVKYVLCQRKNRALEICENIDETFAVFEIDVYVRLNKRKLGAFQQFYLNFNIFIFTGSIY